MEKRGRILAEIDIAEFDKHRCLPFAKGLNARPARSIARPARQVLAAGPYGERVIPAAAFAAGQVFGRNQAVLPALTTKA